MENESLKQSILQKSTQVKYRDKRQLLKIILNISLAAIFSGHVLSYFNSINFDDTIRIFNIIQDRALMQGALSLCTPLGAALGGLLAPVLLSHYSRRESHLIIGYISIFSTVLLITKNIEILFICRLVQGTAMGISFVLRSLFIKQFVPIELTGQFGSINQLMFSVGMILTFSQTYIFSLFMPAESYWVMVYCSPIIFLVVHIYNLHFQFVFQTPKYYLEHGMKAKAEELVKMIYKPKFVQQRLFELEKLLHMIQQKPSNNQMEMKNVGQSKREDKQNKILVSKKSGSGKSNKLAIILAYHLSFLQQITGIQIIIIYAGQILLDIEPSLQKIIPILLQIQGFLGVIISMNLIGKYGRKQMIQKGLIVIAIIHFLVSLSYFWKSSVQLDSSNIALVPSILIVLGLLAYRGIFSITYGPLLWLYLPEIVQPHAVSVATTMHWGMAAFISFIYPVLVEILGGPGWIFAMIVLLIILGYFINDKLMVQTKDRAQWQIRQQFDDKLAKF